MKEKRGIPTTKVARATKFASTGVKVGVNYISYHAERMLGTPAPREKLHKRNASQIYDALSELKGGALKVLQMMSMDQNILPEAYQEQFAMSQYSAPPLSFPLVVKTFKSYFGKHPEEMFDSFSHKAVNAASIGQVHQATLKGVRLAVKVQYPGVADSIESDLKIVKPFAARLFHINERDIDYYFDEIKTRLLEETDYNLELRRSKSISLACEHIKNIYFTKYYEDFSCERVLTMDWLEGQHLEPFIKTNPSQEIRNQLGQALWDFYDFQMHQLRQVHADPHPGNFLCDKEGRLGILDFGCVKSIPEAFYQDYFQLIKSETLQDKDSFEKALVKLNFIHEIDSERDKEIFRALFAESIRLLARPFDSDTFDFSQDEYFKEIFEFGERASQCPELKKSKHGRGPRDGLYINRTYFGLYNLLNKLRATIKVTKPEWLS
jgi:predicted unusual protein kinase regulating ubiquinone biosynthesis (AarF/ABC1/UbiB family)